MTAARETQQSITAWAAETFGEPGSLARVAARVNEEVAELLRAYTAELPAEKIVEEAADSAIVLCRLGDRLGIDVETALRHGNYSWHGLGLQDCVTHATTQMACLVRDLMIGSDAALEEARLYCIRLAHSLQALADALDHNLWEAVEAKMAVNRKRKWKRDGSGHGYHHRSGEDYVNADGERQIPISEEMLGKLQAWEDMIVNCAGTPTNPDSLPQMLLHEIRAVLQAQAGLRQ